MLVIGSTDCTVNTELRNVDTEYTLHGAKTHNIARNYHRFAGLNVTENLVMNK